MSVGLLIADDHDLVRLGLRKMLEGDEFLIFADVGVAEEALRFALDSRVQLVLLDLSWGEAADRVAGKAGFEVLREIHARRPELPIVVYSAETSSHCVERCRHLGARGYLVKGRDEGSVAPAVRAVLAGGQIWPDSRDPWRRECLSGA